MGDNTAPHTPKKQKKLDSEVQANHAKHSKFYNHFLFKASLLVFFLVVLPLFTSEAPEFINQTLQTRSWEVLQLIFVGIAVSYGLFSKKSNEREKEHTSKIDNAQSYVSGLLQVSSVFDDEAESHDENKVQTWNNQYHRGNNPVVVIAKESHGFNEQRAVSSKIGEKPLLLPIRSLKSRVLDPDVGEESNEKSNIGLKGFSSNVNKPRNGDFVVSSPKKMVENIEENVVRPSPIPWRSRSARNMEIKEDENNNNNHPLKSLSPSKENPGFNKIEPFSLRSQSFRSPRPNTSPINLSPSQSFSSSRKLSPSLSFSSESQAKIVEDVVRKKSFRKSTPPPPPPPPPPPAKAPSPPPPVKLLPSPSPAVKQPPPAKKPPVPTPPVSPPKNTADCVPLCQVRCKLHSRQNVCLRACATCCLRCKCVPPGQYGNLDKCGKCYASMTTRGGRRKCP